ncbi:uncharacterized protein LOC121394622 isoform X2 [Xenopus laevis]|uniref:Uncharacterized protein LOC121394622 isoform X2 n=1 Tax=Xenopus laevis TaxID=8355 RepID=A0A8J1KXG1_XENLA|nr:uncharacterized protein LOC121394622 isoform X2 [Xenopus laevis]
MFPAPQKRSIYSNDSVPLIECHTMYNRGRAFKQITHYTGSTELALKSLQCRLQETLGPLVSRKTAAVTTGVVSATWNWRISRLVSITL